MSTIGENIRRAREKAGLTQDELAQKLGYKTRSSIAKIENGTNDIPQSKIAKIAEALNTTPSVIMGWDNPENDNNSKVKISDLFYMGDLPKVMGELSKDQPKNTGHPTNRAQRRHYNNDDLAFALFGTTDVDDEVIEDVRKYAEIARRMREEKKKEG